MYLYCKNTSIGEINITADDNSITGLFFVTPEGKFEIKETELINTAFSQLNEYLSGKRKSFSFKLSPGDSGFRLSVLNKINEIPYGETRSYKEIAKAVNNEKACRAVGMAANKNPIPIFIPCHRVIGSNGSLTGYAGGLKIKEILLKTERENN